MIVKITEVSCLGGTRLHLRFDDGAAGEIDVAKLVPFSGVFARLGEPGEFEKVYVDAMWGTICWPDGLDLAPEALYEEVTGRNPLAGAKEGTHSPPLDH